MKVVLFIVHSFGPFSFFLFALERIPVNLSVLGGGISGFFFFLGVCVDALALSLGWRQIKKQNENEKGKVEKKRERRGRKQQKNEKGRNKTKRPKRKRKERSINTGSIVISRTGN